MRRPGGLSIAILISILFAALFVALSCEREKRTFEVKAADAKFTHSTTNTSLAPGGMEAEQLVAFEPPSPPPDELESNANELAQGQQLFHAMNCSGCHGSYGGGGIGPALSDETWIYGWQPEIIFDTIAYGRPNGMPAFRGKLSDREIWRLVGFVRSLSDFASPNAAPGREDHMRGPVPPNSLSRPHPRISTTELDDLRHQHREELQRMGWTDPDSGTFTIPKSAMRAVTRPTTQPAAPH